MTVSASIVFRKSEDNLPCLATQAWWHAGMQYAHDSSWHKHRSHIRVCNAEISIHRRPISVSEGDIRTSLVFDHLN
jgi:hypothetical protein